MSFFIVVKVTRNFDLLLFIICNLHHVFLLLFLSKYINQHIAFVVKRTFMMNTEETKDIEEQFNSLLNETRSYVVYKEFSVHLDKIYKELEKKRTLRRNLDVIGQLAVTFNGVHYNNWLMQPQLLGHGLFLILRDCLI